MSESWFPSPLDHDTSSCPPWCATDHDHEDCHFSRPATFADSNGRRFRIDLARDPLAEFPDQLFIEDLDADHVEPQAGALPGDRVLTIVDALHWAERTAQISGEEFGGLNVAVKVSLLQDLAAAAAGAAR